MRRMLRAFGSQIATTQFKRAVDGWVVRAPMLWPFGRRPHYVVNETEKAKIEVAVGAGSLTILVLIILAALWFVFFPTSHAGLLKSSSDWDNHMLTFVLCCVSLSSLHYAYQYFAFWLLLKNSHRTEEQIAFSERVAPLAKTSSVLLISIFLFLTAMLLFMGYRAIAGPFGDISLYIALAITSWLVIFYGRILLVKRRLHGGLD